MSLLRVTKGRQPPNDEMSEAPSKPAASTRKPLAEVPSSSSTVPMPSGAGIDGDETSEGLGSEPPDLDVDPHAAIGNADQAGLGHRLAGKCVELVGGGGPGRAQELRAEMVELSVERHAR